MFFLLIIQFWEVPWHPLAARPYSRGRRPGEWRPARRCASTRAGTSLKRDFDGNVVLGVVGLHVPAVLVPELLKDLVELCLVSDQPGARSQRLPSSGSQADGRC